MRSRSLRMLLALTLVALASLPSRADLKAYLAKPEPKFTWQKTGERQAPGGTVHELHFVSQEWQGIVWEHNLRIYVPEKIDMPGICALMNTGGSGGAGDDALGLTVAQASGCIFAIVHNNPKQPLYGGLVEDALIVYTWKKFLETRDESWPLHFPMAKAVIKGMDVVQAYAAQAKWAPIKSFVVTGASKRGWTTWLVGASGDKRVIAIAPMVIDTLNLKKQLPHMLEMYAGSPSEEIDDYTKAGILPMLQAPEAQRLLELEDPYSYRDVLTLPKLLINGTNDRYWAQDALNIYWDDLKGPKWVLYTPNSGHGLEDRARVFATLSAFIRKTGTKAKWPQMKWNYETAGDTTNLTIASDVKPVSARLFRAASASKDFRDSKWTSEPMAAAAGGFAGSIQKPSSGNMAIFGEATYEIGGKQFTLSTQIRILESAK